MERLAPPYMQLGAYWDELREERAFEQLVCWLLDRGYELARTALTVSTADGHLPRFRQSGLDLPATAFRLERAFDRRALSSREWLPIEVRLSPTQSEGVTIHVAYATMYDESHDAGDKHVVEIAASSGPLDAVYQFENELDMKTIREADRLDRWLWQTFRPLCDELKPLYAAVRCEREVQPPASQLASKAVVDYCDMYFADIVGLGVVERARLAKSGVCSVVRFESGTFVSCCLGCHDESPGAKIVVNTVRERLQEYFGSVRH